MESLSKNEIVALMELHLKNYIAQDSARLVELAAALHAITERERASTPLRAA